MKALILDCPNKSGNDIGESGNDIGEPGNDITWLKDLSPICQETFGYLLSPFDCILLILNFHKYRADFIIDKKVLVDLKGIRKFTEVDEACMIKSHRASGRTYN
jgi:hypothetical protein